MNARPFFAIVVKDLKLHVGNPRSMIFLLALPIAIASFFGYVFGGGGGKAKPSGVSLAVVDLDQSPVSREIITNLESDRALRVSRMDEADARGAVAGGKTSVAVIFPKGFGEASGGAFFRPGTKPELTALHDPSKNMESEMVEGMLTRHIMETVGREAFSGAGARKAVQEALSGFETNGYFRLGGEDRCTLSNMLSGVGRWLARTNAGAGGSGGAGGFSMPFTIKSEESARPKGPNAIVYNGYAHSFGGMNVQFVLMAGVEWGVLVLLERQRGLWRRLRAAPLSLGVLLAGRAASSTIIALFTLAVSWGFSMAVFGVRIDGSVAGFIVCNVAFALFAASLGLFVAALGRTPEATRSLAIFVVLIMVMLGGAWVPSFIFPEWLQKLTLFVPTRWAVDGFDAMTWRGMGLGAAWGPAAVMVGYAAVLGEVARRRFRWDAE